MLRCMYLFQSSSEVRFIINSCVVIIYSSHIHGSRLTGNVHPVERGAVTMTTINHTPSPARHRLFFMYLTTSTLNENTYLQCTYSTCIKHVTHNNQ